MERSAEPMGTTRLRFVLCQNSPSTVLAQTRISYRSRSTSSFVSHSTSAVNYPDALTVAELARSTDTMVALEDLAAVHYPFQRNNGRIQPKLDGVLGTSSRLHSIGRQVIGGLEEPSAKADPDGGRLDHGLLREVLRRPGRACGPPRGPPACASARVDAPR